MGWGTSETVFQLHSCKHECEKMGLRWQVVAHATRWLAPQVWSHEEGLQFAHVMTLTVAQWLSFGVDGSRLWSEILWSRFRVWLGDTAHVTLGMWCLIAHLHDVCLIWCENLVGATKRSWEKGLVWCKSQPKYQIWLGSSHRFEDDPIKIWMVGEYIT